MGPYGQDLDFALFIIVGWVAFMIVAAIVEYFIVLRNTTPKTYTTPKWF